MMTRERAKELIREQNQFPYWGNFSRFMTPSEKEEINALWDEASKANGELSFASIIYRIGRGADPITGQRKE